MRHFALQNAKILTFWFIFPIIKLRCLVCIVLLGFGFACFKGFGTMIEAANSVIFNAPFLRMAGDQVSSSRTSPVDMPRVQETPKAPFVSPFVYVDVNHNTAVLQIRNGETGEVESQFPSEKSLEARLAEMASGSASEARSLISPSDETETVSEGSSRVPETSNFSSLSSPPAVDSSSSGSSSVDVFA